jgi:hypothetical protein
MRTIEKGEQTELNAFAQKAFELVVPRITKTHDLDATYIPKEKRFQASIISSGAPIVNILRITPDQVLYVETAADRRNVTWNPTNYCTLDGESEDDPVNCEKSIPLPLPDPNYIATAQYLRRQIDLAHREFGLTPK